MIFFLFETIYHCKDLVIHGQNARFYEARGLFGIEYYKTELIQINLRYQTYVVISTHIASKRSIMIRFSQDVGNEEETKNYLDSEINPYFQLRDTTYWHIRNFKLWISFKVLGFGKKEKKKFKNKPEKSIDLIWRANWHKMLQVVSSFIVYILALALR